MNYLLKLKHCLAQSEAWRNLRTFIKNPPVDGVVATFRLPGELNLRLSQPDLSWDLGRVWIFPSIMLLENVFIFKGLDKYTIWVRSIVWGVHVLSS